MILTKRCLVLSIRIQLQILTFLAITVELRSRKGSMWLHSLARVMMEICEKLSREPFEVPGQEPLGTQIWELRTPVLWHLEE